MPSLADTKSENLVTTKPKLTCLQYDNMTIWLHGEPYVSGAAVFQFISSAKQSQDASDTDSDKTWWKVQPLVANSGSLFREILILLIMTFTNNYMNHTSVFKCICSLGVFKSLCLSPLQVLFFLGP